MWCPFTFVNKEFSNVSKCTILKILHNYCRKTFAIQINANSSVCVVLILAKKKQNLSKTINLKHLVNALPNLWWLHAGVPECAGERLALLRRMSSVVQLTIETGQDNHTGPDGRTETLTNTSHHTTRVLSPSAPYCCPTDTSTRHVKTSMHNVCPWRTAV